MTIRARGFTLIEVMVALAIVTLAVAAMLGSMTSAADNVYFLRDKTFAEWVALNRIAEVRLAPALPKKGKTDGEAELAGRNWTWQQEVLPMQIEGTFQINVSVRPRKEGETAGASATDKIAWYATVSGMIGDIIDRKADDFRSLDMSKGFQPVEPKPRSGNPDPGKDEEQETQE